VKRPPLASKYAGETAKDAEDLPSGMPTEWWLLGVLAVVHTSAIVVAYRYSRTAAATRSQPTDDVVCAECGTDNEPAYRFCRGCVAELHGPGGPPGASHRPAGGRQSN
jgi:hypothetical protein